MKTKILKFFIVIIFIITLAIIVLSFLNKKIMPVYLNYATSEVKSLLTTVITKSINEDLLNQYGSELFIVQNDLNNGTTMVDFDPIILNRLMSNISNTVYDNLKLLSQKDEEILQKYNVSDSVFYVPSGIIFNSPVLNNLGPKIPINMEVISLVNPNIETKVTEYGINNSLVEVFINIKASIRMFLPLSSNEVEVTVILPVAVKLIQGIVPDYYLGGLTPNKSS